MTNSNVGGTTKLKHYKCVNCHNMFRVVDDVMIHRYPCEKCGQVGNMKLIR